MPAIRTTKTLIAPCLTFDKHYSTTNGSRAKALKAQATASLHGPFRCPHHWQDPTGDIFRCPKIYDDVEALRDHGKLRHNGQLEVPTLTHKLSQRTKKKLKRNSAAIISPASSLSSISTSSSSPAILNTVGTNSSRGWFDSAAFGEPLSMDQPNALGLSNLPTNAGNHEVAHFPVSSFPTYAPATASASAPRAPAPPVPAPMLSHSNLLPEWKIGEEPASATLPPLPYIPPVFPTASEQEADRFIKQMKLQAQINAHKETLKQVRLRRKQQAAFAMNATMPTPSQSQMPMGLTSGAPPVSGMHGMAPNSNSNSNSNMGNRVQRGNSYGQQSFN